MKLKTMLVPFFWGGGGRGRGSKQGVLWDRKGSEWRENGVGRERESFLSQVPSIFFARRSPLIEHLEEATRWMKHLFIARLVGYLSLEMSEMQIFECSESISLFHNYIMYHRIVSAYFKDLLL